MRRCDSVTTFLNALTRLSDAPVEAAARLYRPFTDGWRRLLLPVVWMVVVGGGTAVWFGAIISTPLRPAFERGGPIGWLLLAPLLGLWVFGSLGGVRAVRTPGPRGSPSRRIDDALPESPITDEHWRSGLTAAQFLDEDLDNLEAGDRKRIRATLESGVDGDAGNVERILDRSDQNVAAFAANLAELVEHGETPERTIEYLSRTHADVLTPYADLLYEHIEGERPNKRLMLALARIACADASHADAVTERLVAVADLESAKRRAYAAGALGILASEQPPAREALAEFGTQHDPDVRAVAAAAERFYREHPDGRFSPRDVIVDRFYENASTDRDEQASSAGTDGLQGDYSYVCEDCGATLWDLWDVTAAGDSYSCGVCGHDLDDQEGAKKTYQYG
jgi:ParB-like chromosome segregation protein Spo0J